MMENFVNNLNITILMFWFQYIWSLLYYFSSLSYEWSVACTFHLDGKSYSITDVSKSMDEGGIDGGGHGVKKF